jgi:heme/copper-type cytochrome/quinol oxidase subunit 1
MTRRHRHGRVDARASSSCRSSSTSSRASSGAGSVDKNPWEATTLEWSAPSPPGHGNFLTEPIRVSRAVRVQRAGLDEGLHPQFEPEKGIADEYSRTPSKKRPDTG